ncbi:MAG: DinB family protein, partial [Pseudomonadota bacterium]
FQHQIHHRGQAHVQLSDVGLAPPQLDEFFLEFDRAPIAQEYFA